MKPAAFNVTTVPRRLAGLRTDPWKTFRRAGQTLTAAMRKKVGLA